MYHRPPSRNSITELHAKRENDQITTTCSKFKGLPITSSPVLSTGTLRPAMRGRSHAASRLSMLAGWNAGVAATREGVVVVFATRNDLCAIVVALAYYGIGEMMMA